jgi:LmbE family N-acetylglucosaminyl deacetylase
MLIMKTILLSFAHPDDECFATGLVAVKYAAAAWKVNLITATLGEVGLSGPYTHLHSDALGAVRRVELEKAARILGISFISFLGYKDGTLKSRNNGELEDKIYRKMVEMTPDIVITFDTTGISNHPDHIKMSYATTFAFQRYCRELADTRRFVSDINSGQGYVKVRNFTVHHKYALKQKSFADVVASDIEPKLYYACLPETVASYLKRAQVIPEDSFGKPMIGIPDKSVTTVIEGKRYRMKKIRALKTHITQRDNTGPFINFESNPLLLREYFILRMQGITEIFMGKKDRISARL